MRSSTTVGDAALFAAGMRTIRGSGGSKESDPSTLRSNSLLQLVEIVSEGEIDGIVGGGQGIYFANVPLINANNTVNYSGVTFEMRTGTAQQTPMLGLSTAQQVFPVGVECKYSIEPPVRTISNPDATSVTVTVQIPALFTTDDSGNVLKSSVYWSIQIRPAGGVWVQAAYVGQTDQKCVSPYEQATNVPLPPGGYPWDVRVVRMSPDETKDNAQSTTSWLNYVEVTQFQGYYPYTAVVAMQVDASLFNQGSLPDRKYHIRGIKCPVPSNYDPIARTYTGDWDGSFKYAWTNNPAWIFYDLLTNNRYGVGDLVNASSIDKTNLYQISRYCDEPVADGYGKGGTEPRYTFNGQIRNAQDAFKVLGQIASSFRGVVYWALGQAFAVADMPVGMTSDGTSLVSNENVIAAQGNVIDGDFEYDGTSRSSRHSVAIVSWSNPKLFGDTDYEVVIDDESMALFGWRELHIDAIGCTSRGQAHRYGLWALDTEKYSTETVTYTAGLDHASVKPGRVVSVFDRRKSQARTGGRVALVDDTLTVVTLDFPAAKPFVPFPGETYKLFVTMPDGTVESRVVNDFGDGRTVTLAAPFPAAPVVGAMFGLVGFNHKPRQYRIISLAETAPTQNKVVGLTYDPTKYARVEQGVALTPLPFAYPKQSVDAPINFSAVESVYTQNNVSQNKVTLSWTPANDLAAVGYFLTGIGPNGPVNYGYVSGTSREIIGIVPGKWTWTLVAKGYNGNTSPPVTLTANVLAWSAIALGYPTALQLFGRGTATTFGGKDVRVVWRNAFPGTTANIGSEPTGAGASGTNPYYRDNLVRIYKADGTTLLRTESVTTGDYTYTYDHNVSDNAALGGQPQRSLVFSVTVRDNLGRESDPVTLAVSNPAPALTLPTVTADFANVYVAYKPPADLDETGVYVWVSPTKSFDPLTTKPSYAGSASIVTVNVGSMVPASGTTTLYVRMACYDAFPDQTLNVSPAVAVTVGSAIIDTTPAPVPTGLALATAIVTTATGGVVPSVTATVDPPPAGSNWAQFDFEIAPHGTSAWQQALTTNAYVTWAGINGATSYDVRVRAKSKAGYFSAYAAVATITSAAKTTPPGVVTGLSATAGTRAVQLAWTNPTDADLGGVEVWRTSGGDVALADATRVGTVQGQAFADTGLVTGALYDYWVRPFNTSGVFAAFTGPVSATPAAVASGDIGAGAVTADAIASGAITADKLAAGAVTAGTISLTGGRTLASWQHGVDQTLINGGAIAADTITAASLTTQLRGVSVSGLAFSLSGNIGTAGYTVSWTAGTITYYDANGALQTVSLPAESYKVSTLASAFTGEFYISYSMGADDVVSSGSLAGSDDSATTILLAFYAPRVGLVPLYGASTISGTDATLGQVTAAAGNFGSMLADSIFTTTMGVGTLTPNTVSQTSNAQTGGLGTAAMTISNGNFVLLAPGNADPMVTIGVLTATSVLTQTGVGLRVLGPFAQGATVPVFSASGSYSTVYPATLDGGFNANGLVNDTMTTMVQFSGWAVYNNATGATLSSAPFTTSAPLTTLTNLQSQFGAGSPLANAGVVDLSSSNVGELDFYPTTPGSTLDIVNESVNQQRYPVIPFGIGNTGQVYEASAYLLPSACTGAVFIAFYDASGNLLSRTLGTNSGTTAYTLAGKADLTQYFRSRVVAVAPSKATTMVMGIRCTVPSSPASPAAASMNWTRPLLTMCKNSSFVTPWRPGVAIADANASVQVYAQAQAMSFNEAVVGQLTANAVTVKDLKVTNATFQRMVGGVIQSADGSMVIDLNAKFISFSTVQVSSS